MSKHLDNDIPQGITAAPIAWEYVCELCSTAYAQITAAQSCIDQHLSEFAQTAKFKPGDYVRTRARGSGYLITGYAITQVNTIGFDSLKWAYPDLGGIFIHSVLNPTRSRSCRFAGTFQLESGSFRVKFSDKLELPIMCDTHTSDYLGLLTLRQDSKYSTACDQNGSPLHAVTITYSKNKAKSIKGFLSELVILRMQETAQPQFHIDQMLQVPGRSIQLRVLEVLPVRDLAGFSCYLIEQIHGRDTLVRSVISEDKLLSWVSK